MSVPEMTPKEISRAADRVFLDKLPSRLVARNQQDQEDFGIDYEIELMHAGDQPSGDIFKVQQKGTLKLEVIDNGTTISFRDLSIEKARYYLREIHVPAAFVIVDVPNKEAYWVEMQGNEQLEWAFGAAVERQNKTLAVHVPIKNGLPQTTNELLRAMQGCQNAIMLRDLSKTASLDVLQAAIRNPNFDQTVQAARRHTDILRLEQVERLIPESRLALDSVAWWHVPT